MTLYEELELTPDCSFDDIKQQYRTLAGIHHPDKGGDEEKFKRIKFAYEVLGDPIRRKQYDDTATTDESTDIRTEAINYLATVFFQIIPNFNCAGGNLIESLKMEINSVMNRTLADDLMCDVYIGNLEIVKSKLKLKNPNKEDVVMSFIEKQLDNRLADKKIFAHRTNLLNETLTILDDYQYGFLELVGEMPTET